MITTKEIAKLAGVSRGTVDRVIHNRGKVRKEVEERIREIAAQLDYQTNSAGRVLSITNKRFKVAIILNYLNTAFFDDIANGIIARKNDEKTLSIEYVLHKLPYMSAKLVIQMMDEANSAGDVDLFIISGLDEKLLARKIDELAVRGVPVITVSNDVEGSKRLTYVGCDHYKSGRIAAGLMGLLCNGSGSVCIVSGENGIFAEHRQRVNGFEDVLREKYPGIHVATIIENHDDEFESYSKVSEYLKTHPDITALYFVASGVVGGMRAVMDVMKEKRPIVVANSSNPQTKDMVCHGKIDAIISQQPFEQGFRAMDIAIKWFLTNGLVEFSDTVHLEGIIYIQESLTGSTEH